MFNNQYSLAAKGNIRHVIEPYMIKGNPNFNYYQFDEDYYGFKPATNFQDKPFEGKVVAETVDHIVIKTGRKEFVSVGKSIASLHPPVGKKVRITPYVRRYFNGHPIDKPAEGGFLLIGAAVTIPVAKPSCYELEQIISILENDYAKDGSRRIAEMLVDAMAKDFHVVDPQPDEIFTKYPSISFNVCTGKYTGSVKLSHNTNNACYELEFRPCGSLERANIFKLKPTEIGIYLSNWIDDGCWKVVKVEII